MRMTRAGFLAGLAANFGAASAQGFGNVTPGQPVLKSTAFERFWNPGGYTNVQGLIRMRDGAIGGVGRQGYLEPALAELLKATRLSGAFFARWDMAGEPLAYANYTAGAGVREHLSGEALAEADDGDVFLAAAERRDTAYQTVLFRLSATGEERWRKALLGPPSQRANHVVATADGGAIVFAATQNVRDRSFDSTVWIAKVSASGEIEGQSVFPGTSGAACSTGDGGFAFPIGPGPNVLKVDATGKEVWRSPVTGEGRLSVGSISAVQGGFAVVATIKGERTGAWLSEVIRLDGEGKEMWAHRLSLARGTFAIATHGLADGSVAVAGWLRQRDTDPTQGMVVVVSPDGASSRSLVIAPRNADRQLSSIVSLADGALVVGGRADETVFPRQGGGTYFTARGWLRRVALDELT